MVIDLERAAEELPEEEEEAEEEMLLPDDPSSVDPAVLSTLPPSMQMDILLRLREQHQQENRCAIAITLWLSASGRTLA